MCYNSANYILNLMAMASGGVTSNNLLWGN